MSEKKRTFQFDPKVEGKSNPLPPPPPPPTEEVEPTFIKKRSAVQRDLVELLLLDSKEYLQEQFKMKEKIEQHLAKYGGDMSMLLASKPIPSKMKCIILTSFGLSKNINTATLPLVLPVKNEVLIRSYSCGVSFQDVMARQGLLDSWVRSRKPPYIMGSEVAGQIIAVGSSVTGLKVGDRVVALPEFQAWCEYPICPSACCYKIPDDMTYHEAVAIAADGVIAYTLLFEMGALRPGKCVLIHSAPGGLGDMVSQMAKTVENVQLFNIATVPQEDCASGSIIHNIERGVDYASEIRHVSPLGVDLVLDCQCEDNFHKDYNLLKPLGKYILYGTQSAATGETRGFFGAARAWWGMEKVSPLKLYEDNKTICGFNLRHLLYFQRQYKYVHSVLHNVFELWRVGAIKPVFDCVLHFDDHVEAMQRMLDQSHVGKIVLDPMMTKEDMLHTRDYLIVAEKIQPEPTEVTVEEILGTSSSSSEDEILEESNIEESIPCELGKFETAVETLPKHLLQEKFEEAMEVKDVLPSVEEVEREIEKSFEMEEVEETEALIPKIPLRKGKVEMKEVKVGEIIPSFIAPILETALEKKTPKAKEIEVEETIAPMPEIPHQEEKVKTEVKAKETKVEEVSTSIPAPVVTSPSVRKEVKPKQKRTPTPPFVPS